MALQGNKVSVCIATFNGERHIRKQLDSILKQLGLDDEIIIVDDCSIDKTVSIIKSFNDKRIKLFSNEENRGHVFTFEKAIYLSTKDVIFLSDQDDIWIPGRLKLMLNSLMINSVLLVSSNFEIQCNDEKRKQEIIKRIEKGILKLNDSSNYIKNIWGIFCGRSNYYGCAMAFRRDLLNVILPIPQYIESHDVWIAIAANLYSSNLHLEEKTLIRHIHDKNVSKTDRTFGQKIKSRITFLRSIFSIKWRKILIAKG